MNFYKFFEILKMVQEKHDFQVFRLQPSEFC